MRRSLSLILATITATAACAGEPGAASSTSTDDINGGERSSRPDVLFLFENTPDGTGFRSCSAVLVAPRVFLTAGHCKPMAYASNDVSSAAVLGKTSPTLGSAVRVSRWVAASEALACGDQGELDLVVGTLERPLAEAARPLPISIDVPAPGARCDIVGHGRHAAKGSVTLGEQRSATVNVVGPSDPIWKELGYPYSSRGINVVRGSGAPMSGDSGGPLFCGGRLVGVDSCSVYTTLADRDAMRPPRASVYTPLARARAFLADTFASLAREDRTLELPSLPP